MDSKLLSLTEIESCPVHYVLAINDALNALRGQWKLPLITALLHETKRFSDLQRALPRITPRILAKELRELELNSIVERRVHDTIPVLIEYQLTPSSRRPQAGARPDDCLGHCAQGKRIWRPRKTRGSSVAWKRVFVWAFGSQST